MTDREETSKRERANGREATSEETTSEREATNAGITARYYETDDERVLEFDSDGATAAVAQNVEGYAMLKVRPTPDGDELERYYGFDMALDHVGELLRVSPRDLPVPDGASDMGM
jgi:hypothetical protein